MVNSQVYVHIGLSVLHHSTCSVKGLDITQICSFLKGEVMLCMIRYIIYGREEWHITNIYVHVAMYYFPNMQLLE